MNLVTKTENLFPLNCFQITKRFHKQINNFLITHSEWIVINRALTHTHTHPPTHTQTQPQTAKNWSHSATHNWKNVTYLTHDIYVKSIPFSQYQQVSLFLKKIDLFIFSIEYFCNWIWIYCLFVCFQQLTNYRGSDFSSHETELRNRITQNDVTLPVTNSKMFTEILLSSY